MSPKSPLAELVESSSSNIVANLVPPELAMATSNSPEVFTTLIQASDPHVPDYLARSLSPGLEVKDTYDTTISNLTSLLEYIPQNELELAYKEQSIRLMNDMIQVRLNHYRDLLSNDELDPGSRGMITVSVLNLSKASTLISLCEFAATEDLHEETTREVALES